MGHPKKWQRATVSSRDIPAEYLSEISTIFAFSLNLIILSFTLLRIYSTPSSWAHESMEMVLCDLAIPTTLSY